MLKLKLCNFCESFQVPDPLPGSSWSFPRWPAELLPVSELASLPGPRSLAGHTRLGTWHITLSQDKGATFGGHLSVLGPAVLSPNWGFTFVVLQKIGQDVTKIGYLSSYFKHLTTYIVQQYNKFTIILD